MSPDFHKCSSTGDLDNAAYNALVVAEFDRLHSQINEKAVCELASGLNGGKPCTVEYPSEAVGSNALTGCANYHARIRFSDGTPSWLMRVPRVTGFTVGFPVRLAEYLVRSEYATLKFLETTAVPAPRAFSFGLPSQGTDHGIGVCFLLMEELSGKPWDGQGDTAKVWKGLADIFAELEKYPFTKAGSLYVEHPDGQPSISAAASDRFILYRFLQDNAARLTDPEGKFFLKHVDDKGDHLMVDDHLNIIGIIDWQMTRVVPRREAFALSLVSADMAALCDGNVPISEDDVALSNALREKGSELASYTGDERVRRFFSRLGLEAEWTYALPLANAILQVFGAEQSWDEWKEEALKQYETGERLKALLGNQ
ncbi:hypothetical protein K402DRAFT_411000 [Aulographum hederae CBS 113979]|uniref:Aminoglycoside phosphotransferase domain-containing protein n=1 Tax=Aulographum hederae CBS 113979 TaxID=1176131 RepID=A0A6G1H832_9PEZI|nr:hypothetical protein K402DRAFT_411000 [Aulographum hederae CBS 113979]